MQSTAARAVTPASRACPDRRWDAVVVGGGFAGLSTAREAARQGLRVLVLDRLRSPGARVHTTGLLCPDSLDALQPPGHVLGTRVDALRLTGPGLGEGVRIERVGAGFTPTDTGALLEELAGRAAAAGAELRWGATVRGIEGLPGRRLVHAGGERIACDRVVGADGARSTVARSLGFSASTDLLVGLERHYEPARTGDLGADEALLILSGRWAPGYAVWAVPGAHGRWQLGLLGRPGRGFHPGRALDEAAAALEARRGVRWGAPCEVRAGWVPVDGARRVAALPGAVLAGDAAGHVSELTAGGIGRAFQAGAALGRRLGEGPAAWERELERAAGRCGGLRRPLRGLLRLATRPGLDRLAACAAGLPFARALLAEAAFRRHPFAAVPGWDPAAH